jgi:ketosteroid isomerase-like protein
MERDRVERVHEVFEIWNSRGVEAFAAEAWHPDIVWEEAAGFPEAGTRHGRQACVNRMVERFAAVGHVGLEIVDVELVGERATLIEMIVRGRGQASGAPTEMHDWFVTEIDDEGLTVRMREFLSRDAAERAAEELTGERRGAPR